MQLDLVLALDSGAERSKSEALRPPLWKIIGR